MNEHNRCARMYGLRESRSSCKHEIRFVMRECGLFGKGRKRERGNGCISVSGEFEAEDYVSAAVPEKEVFKIFWYFFFSPLII